MQVQLPYKTHTRPTVKLLGCFAGIIQLGPYSEAFYCGYCAWLLCSVTVLGYCAWLLSSCDRLHTLLSRGYWANSATDWLHWGTICYDLVTVHPKWVPRRTSHSCDDDHAHCPPMIYTCPFSVPCPIFQQQLLLWAECSFLLFLWYFAGLCLLCLIFVSARVQFMFPARFPQKRISSSTKANIYICIYIYIYIMTLTLTVAMTPTLGS